MKKRRMAMGVILAALVAWLAWEILREREPVYQGKTLSVWLECMTNLPGMGTFPENWGVQLAGWQNPYWNTTNAVEVRKAVNAMGIKALPALRKMVRYRDATLKLKIERLAGRQKLIDIRFKSEDELHLEAALGCLGAEPSVNNQLVGDWIQYLDDASRENAKDAVATMYFLTAMHGVGVDGLKPLVIALTNANPLVKQVSAEVLSEKLMDKDFNARKTTKNALKQIDPDVMAKVKAAEGK